MHDYRQIFRFTLLHIRSELVENSEANHHVTIVTHEFKAKVLIFNCTLYFSIKLYLGVR